jgi:predicted nucleic-acid-binding Zn-ribbon protein
MFQQKQCPCCGDHSQIQYEAIIAPFIQDYIKLSNNKSTTILIQCGSCGHRYFEDRFDDHEMEQLYSGYRGDSYFQIRRKNEPWYSSGVNTSNLDPNIISKRKEGLKNFLIPFLTQVSENLIVADIGGDAGQFIPLEIADQAYVVEASAQMPVSGVIRVDTINDIPKPVNLLMCAHVLEHIATPEIFINEILSSSNLSPNCIFYFEVPLERFYISPMLKSKWYQKYLRSIVPFRRITIGVDFFSVLSRSYLNAVFPPFVMKLHEHLNYYTKLSLSKLMLNTGLEVVEVIEEKASNLSTHQGVIRLIARKIKP